MKYRIQAVAAGHKSAEVEPVERDTIDEKQGDPDKCSRCGGSGIDPEDSHTGSYGGWYDEPPTLEPCRDCAHPEQDKPKDEE